MAGIIYSEGSGLNNSIIGKQLAPIRAVLNENAEAFENKSMIKELFYMDKSKHFAEHYTSETALGLFQDVGEGGKGPVNGFQEGFGKTIEPFVWKNNFVVAKEMLDDALFGKIKSRANAFMTSYGRTREMFAAAMLAGGINKKTVIWGKSYDTTGADGVELFSKSHPSATMGTKFLQSNMFKAAFSTSIMDQVQENMQSFCDDDKNLLALAPDTIIIPNNAKQKRDVLAAIGSELDPNTNNNAMNFQCGLWNLLIWPYLPKTLGGQPYFMMADKQFLQDYMCMPWIDRKPLEVSNYKDENTDDIVYKGYARYGAGFNNWRGIAICGAGLTNGTELTA